MKITFAEKVNPIKNALVEKFSKLVEKVFVLSIDPVDFNDMLEVTEEMLVNAFEQVDELSLNHNPTDNEVGEQN